MTHKIVLQDIPVGPDVGKIRRLSLYVVLLLAEVTWSLVMLNDGPSTWFVVAGCAALSLLPLVADEIGRLNGERDALDRLRWRDLVLTDRAALLGLLDACGATRSESHEADSAPRVN